VGEILRIQHSATTRDLFARGALRAAAWLAGKPAGRYRIEDTFA
jgi:4-hydroxy-tetrahydrodipicolinate reductase